MDDDNNETENDDIADDETKVEDYTELDAREYSERNDSDEGMDKDSDLEDQTLEDSILKETNEINNEESEEKENIIENEDEELDHNIDEDKEIDEKETEEEMRWKLEMNHYYLPGNFPKLPEVFNADEFPPSYSYNSVREEACLELADNFRRQFRLLYGDRKPLFLTPQNEMGQRKLVCTYIKPTAPPYPTLHYWEGAAKFVASAITPVPLSPVTQTPLTLLAPETALSIGLGTSFEASCLLTCLLLGSGYNAFIVNGYATREICYWDEIRQDCPYDEKPILQDTKPPPAQRKKYSLRPPKDLRSKYELEQEARKVREEEVRIEKIRKEVKEQELQDEKPFKDPLFGQRVHSWVLILSGKREIGENFFIEPFTGVAHAIDSEEYLGIESIWNDKNYFVNMQNVMNGIGHLNFDLNNTSLWEFLLPGQESITITPPYENKAQIDTLEDDDKNLQGEKYFDLPKSWTKPLNINLTQFEKGSQYGHREVVYRKAKVDLYAPYVSNYGFVNRIKKFEDRQLRNVEKTIENFNSRKDKLMKKVEDPKTETVSEYFDRGRSSHLKEYHCTEKFNENTRIFRFYYKSRVDHLMEIIDKVESLTTFYKDRDDYLMKRIVHFCKKEKKFGPATEKEYQKSFETIIELYDRNPAIEAHKDIQEITYHLLEDRIQIYFHPDKNNIAGDMIDFVKSHANSDARRGSTVLLARDACTTFQVDPYREKMSEVENYQYFKTILEKEENCKNSIRNEELEIKNIIKTRTEEMIANNLVYSLFDRVRNVSARNKRIDLEKQIENDKNRKQDEELDYLEPFLLQLNISPDEYISKETAEKVYIRCLEDFRERATNKANILQDRFEKETKELEKKENWYQQHQNIIKKKEEEEEYIQGTKEISFKIKTLEKLIARHKQTNQRKEEFLKSKLMKDQRLAAKFNVNNMISK